MRLIDNDIVHEKLLAKKPLLAYSEKTIMFSGRSR